MTIAIILIVVSALCYIFSQFLFGILSWLLGLLTSITGSEMFGIPAVNSIFTLVGIWSGVIIFITIIMLVVRLMLEISEGKNVSLGANIRAIIVGLILAVFGFDLGKGIFFLGELIRRELVSKIIVDTGTLGTKVQSVLMKTMGSMTSTISFDQDLQGLEVNKFSSAFADFFAILVLIVFIYQIFKLLVETFERTMMYFYTLIQMPIFVSMYINGNDQALSTWFKQLGSIMFGLALRFVGVNLAFYLLVSPTPVFGSINLFAVIGVLMATGKADQALQSFGASNGWGGSGRVVSSTMSSGAHMSSHLKNIFTKGGG
ncbi:MULTISPECIES: hypothetical protein [Erysipelothrix]|uniref:hypothetical protein n=1 Tax=Erysipelothrix TaxID=1647 RepID=UPI00140DD15B|nr:MULTISPECIES: hypothetical protein [Erysipelothrix]MDV7678466.1 hypothetical protein [Erysipelothrix rhusiopathiae]WMT70166.1 hypothetical protein K0H77_01250 [Erysipelothrix rhusiopathiae]